MITVAEHLAQARDHIAKGWTKGEYRGVDGSVCSVAAIERVAMENLTNGGIVTCEPAKERLLKKLKEVLGKDNELVSIPALNDDADTHKDDVLYAFDKATIEAEECGE